MEKIPVRSDAYFPEWKPALNPFSTSSFRSVPAKYWKGATEERFPVALEVGNFELPERQEKFLRRQKIVNKNYVIGEIFRRRR